MENNISRFAAIISKLEPFFQSQHKDNDIETMRQMLERASVNEVSVLICGEFKRGKSSFINAFLGLEVCPTDPGIATSVISVIKYGTVRKVTRIFGDVKNLQSEEVSYEDIEKYAKGSSLEVGNTLMLQIELPSEKLKNGLVLMDTPGVGGLDPRHLFLTLYAMPKADLTFFVIDASEPLTSTELDFYKDKILQYAPSARIIMNKIDLKSQEEICQLIDDTKSKISAHCGVELDKIDVVPVSSMHWSMYNKSKTEKMRTASNCEAVDAVLRQIVPEYKRQILSDLRQFMLDSLNGLAEKLEYKLSQIAAPDQNAQQKYKDRLAELKAMKDDLANPNSATRKKISKIIHSSQISVVNELNRQSVLFSTDSLNILLDKPQAKARNGGEWVLSQLNLGLESIAAEVDQRILQGFSEVNSILGENVNVSKEVFDKRITADLTPAQKGMASRVCGFARNALPGMGIATMTGLALSFVCPPVLVGLGALSAAVGFVFQSHKDANTRERVFDMRQKLNPQITIIMNDLRAYVQERFEAFNNALIESLESMTAKVVAEMQEVISELKGAEADSKVAGELRKRIQGQLNFVKTHHKQVELLLTNPFIAE